MRPAALPALRQLLPLTVSVFVLLALAACATPSMPAAVKDTPIDLQRYMGKWYVIANIPYFAERGNVASVDHYSLRDDDTIDVRFTYRTGFSQPLKTTDSVATVQPGTGNRLWSQRFFHVVPAKYRILEVADDYSWALVDYPGREMAWILARSPDMDDAQYQQLLGKLRGFDVNSDKLWRVPHRADQVGELGFDHPDDP